MTLLHGRLRTAVFAVACVLALALFPALAHAATWTSEYPVGTVRTQPSMVAVDLFSSTKLNAATAQISIAGVAQKTFVTQGSTSGHWTVTETQNPVTGVWSAKWTWVADAGGAKSTLYCYPAALSDGPKAVTVAATDASGTALSHSWSFTVAIPPSIGAPMPVAGSRIKTPTPVIAVPVSDNTGVTSTSATVNGIPAIATLGGGKVTITGFTLAADGPVTVVVTAGDAAGNTTTKTWVFTLSYYANLTCHATACHGTTYDADNAMGPDCVACHPGVNHTAAHAASPAPQLITISNVSFGIHACSECHAPMNLIDLHGSACATCHPTPRASLAGTWAKGCVQGGCHTLGSAAPMHAAIDTGHAIPADKASCLAVGCHDAGAITPFAGRSVAQIHSNASTLTAGVTRSSCQICHTPGTTPTADCLTSGCHPDRAAAHGYDPAMHTGTPTASSFTISGASYPAIACSSCHSTELGVEHTKPTSAGNTGCGECHAGLVAQLPPPWDKTGCAQGNCHAGSSPDPLHGAISTAHARLASAADNTCFASGCHAEGDLASIHSEATATVAGQQRSSCMVCHAQGVPTSKDCTICHADKVASHYDAAQHTATLTSADVMILGVDYGTHACSDCHASAELGVIHTTGCSTCHPTAVASAKPWNKSCATGGCHTAGSTKPMHGSIDPMHTRAASPQADACFADCHAGGASLAAIHANKQGCATCHGSGKTPTADCSASGCHDLSNPHTTLTAVHASSGGSDFVSAGLNNSDHDLGWGEYASCSDCHTMQLVALHANNCLACHRSTDPNVTTAIANHVTACTTCHPSQHTGDNGVHEGFYSAYNCVCHDDASNWDSPTDTCTECHPASTPVPRPTTTSDAKASYINGATIHLLPSDHLYSTFGIKHTYYILDGAAAVDGTLITIAPPTSGTVSHTLQFWSTDWSGLTEVKNTVSFTVSADVLPPTTTCDAISGKTYAGDQVFHLTATDLYSYVAGTWWQLDGTSGAWTSGTTVAVAAPPSGTKAHTLYWYSRDGVGNTETVKSVSFSVLAGRDYSFTGANQTFVVPSGVTTIGVTLYAGSGGSNYWGTPLLLGGLGGKVVAVIPVTSGSTLTVRVGRKGMNYLYGGDGQVHTFGGWPNGGNGGVGNTSMGGGGGGGSSSILLGPSVLVEAGGAGGAGSSAGGNGGAQGTAGGGNQVGGNGNITGGGGGGGWNAGTAGNWLTNGGRGGFGGTSYIAIGSGTLTSGAQTGDGSITIRYSAPG